MITLPITWQVHLKEGPNSRKGLMLGPNPTKTTLGLEIFFMDYKFLSQASRMLESS